MCSNRDKAPILTEGMPCLRRPNSAPPIIKVIRASTIARMQEQLERPVGLTRPTIRREEALREISVVQSSLGSIEDLPCYQALSDHDSDLDSEVPDERKADNDRLMLNECARDLQESAKAKWARLQNEGTPVQSRSREVRQNVLASLRVQSKDCESFIAELEARNLDPVRNPVHHLRPGASRPTAVHSSAAVDDPGSPMLRAKNLRQFLSMENNADEDLVDERYERLHVPAMVEQMRNIMHEEGGCPPPKRLSPRRIEQDRLTRAQMNWKAKEIERYQDGMRLKLQGTGAAPEVHEQAFSPTSSSAAAVREAMMRYHAHCQDVGIRYPQPHNIASSPRLQGRELDSFKLMGKQLRGEDIQKLWPSPDERVNCMASL